jgi:hypothetical protein
MAAVRPNFVGGSEWINAAAGELGVLILGRRKCAVCNVAACPRQQRLERVSARRRSAQLIFIFFDVFHVSGQLTDRQGDLVQLLLNGTSSESAIDVDFYLLARRHSRIPIVL